MVLRIEVDVFSGRSNPAVTLEDNEANVILDRLRPVGRLDAEDIPVPPAYLGYRGFVFRQVGQARQDLPASFRLLRGALLGPGLAHRPDDPAVEQLLAGSDGPLARLELGQDFFPYLQRELIRAVDLAGWPWWRWYPLPWLNPCGCAPLYEPTWWNVPSLQPVNNCYNYASNYRSDSFAQPGRAAGAEFTSYSCASVLAGAVADDLIDSSDADNQCPSYGHLVALVMAPGWDFHWYRKGPDGSWSHKPGSTQVTNVDNSGNPISDPRNANRGPYTEFCTFMVVMDGHIKIA